MNVFYITLLSSFLLIALVFLLLRISKQKQKKNDETKDFSIFSGLSFLGQKIDELFRSHTALDPQVLESLLQILYQADIGVQTADELIGSLRNEPQLSLAEAKDLLQKRILEIVSIEKKDVLQQIQTPQVVLIVGVNGAGKTTTIGKLGAFFQANQKKVLFVAGDTFRAGAIDQLKLWGERLHIPVISHKAGSDPSAVCYDGVKSALSQKADVVLIDTAGRLQNKTDLMNELGKIKRIIGRDIPEAPHHVWLVIDGTTGQNAFSQVQVFKDVAQVTGLIVTKLDGTAKGGVMIGLSHKEKLPIYFVGMGEKSSDLKPFQADLFVKSILTH